MPPTFMARRTRTRSTAEKVAAKAKGRPGAKRPLLVATHQSPAGARLSTAGAADGAVFLANLQTNDDFRTVFQLSGKKNGNAVKLQVVFMSIICTVLAGLVLWGSTRGSNGTFLFGVLMGGGLMWFVVEQLRNVLRQRKSRDEMRTLLRRGDSRPSA